MATNEDALLDDLLARKTNRPAASVFSGVETWFKQTFGSPLPVKNLGASDFERKAGWEHSRAFDVGLHPKSKQGQQLIQYLTTQGIPYSAFTGAVSQSGRTIATGPHIHVGPPSHRIGSQPSTDDGILDQLTSPDDQILNQMQDTSVSKSVTESPADRRASYGARAQEAQFGRPDPRLLKLAYDINWHFGYSVLMAMPTLPVEKQRQIVEMATQFAQEDEAKKKAGKQILESPIWQQRNQKLVGAREGIDIEARTPPTVDAAQRAAFHAGANPLLHLPNSVRLAAESLISGAGGLMEAGAGFADLLPTDPLVKVSRQDGHSAVGEWLSKHAKQARGMAAESQEVSGRGKLTKVAQGVGTGLVEFAPLALVPELGLESAMARIGAAAATGGVYSGTQAVGRGEDAKHVLKEAAVGGATFGLLGVPLPGKSTLTKALSNLVITGGGATVLNKATGATWEDAATQGLVLTLMRSPELIGQIKVKEKGVERPATVADIKGLLPAAKFELETVASELPSALTIPAKGTGRRFVEQPGQGELLSTIAPESREAGRTDLPGLPPPPMTLEQFAHSRGIEPTTAHSEYADYLDRYKTASISSTDTQVAFPMAGPLGETQPVYSGERSTLEVEYVGKNDPTLREVAVLEPEQQSYKLAELYQQRKNSKLSIQERNKIDRQVAYLEKVVDQLPSGPETGVIQMSESTARENLKTLQELKGSETWKKLKKEQQASVDAQIKRLEEQGAGQLPEVPETEVTDRNRPRWTTREQLKANPEQLRLMQREQRGTQNVSRETSTTESSDARVNRVVQEFLGDDAGGFDLDRFKRLLQRLRGKPAEKTQPTIEPKVEPSTKPAKPAFRPFLTEPTRELLADRKGRPQSISVSFIRGDAGKGRTANPDLYYIRKIDFVDRETGERTTITADQLDRNRGYSAPEVGEHNVLSKLQKGFGGIQNITPDYSISRTKEDRWELKIKGRRVGEFDTYAQAREHYSKNEGVQELGEVDAGPISKIKDFLGDEEGTLKLDEFRRRVVTARQTITTLARTRSVREAMAYTRDTVDNEAMIFGRRMRHDVEGPLREALGGLPKEAPDALTFVIESRGNPSTLTHMRGQITASPNAAPGWKKRALAAIDYAQANYVQLQPIADRYKTITDAQVASENAAGIDTLRRDGYVMHAQDIEGPDTGLLSVGGTGESVGFKRVRVHETFADSIAAGVNPKSLNALDLLEARIGRGQRLINRRAWVSDLRSVNDTRTGKSIVADPTIIHRADGTTYPQPPSGYSLEYNGFQPIAVHNGYEGIYSALTDPSWFSKNAATRGFMKVNATGKSISLMLDTFHLGRLAFWQSLIKSLGVKTFKAPLPSFRKGLTLLDSTPAEITRMAARGEIPPEWTVDLMENKRRIDLLVEHGYNVGGISDALYQDFIHAIPGVGDFNKWLFSQFQRGAMTEVGLLEFQRRRAARSTESEAVTARAVVKDLNTRFGNLGRQGIFKSRTGQDIARAIFLAPQWNEGLIRSEIGALTQAGKFVGDVTQGKRLYAGVLMRSVGAMTVGQFAANQLINMITRGHPTWENEEEGWGAKVSAWIPDVLGKGPGFFLHPMGLAAETTHLLLKGYERTEDFAQSLNEYARSRASSAMRPILTFMTRRDYLGHSLKPGTVWGETVRSAIPAPIPGRALYQGAKEVITGKNSEQFPGQYQKQIMSSVGVRTESAPSGEKRLRTLASQFNRKHGVESGGEFYESPYQGLNSNPSVEEVRELIKEKLKNDFTTPQEAKEQIRKYYEQRAIRPLTGSTEREVAFKKTLTPEQRRLYDELRKKRTEERNQIQQLLRQIQ